MVGGKVEETGRIHSCYSCSLTEISWALSATKCDWALSVALSILGSKSEGATSPHVVVHSCTMQIRLVYNVLISLVSPHVHLVCLDSVGCCNVWPALLPDTAAEAVFSWRKSRHHCPSAGQSEGTPG